ncbi:hypothetical protein [Bifidobacterium aerophilum]|uniref:hypothetical protein n=1 Tax=Bifidobacterium aerophilum TaxID=1798155 RepID=UPI0013D38F93|nr:hypothetical protein [Bifidobacterium aerophilum]
MHVRDFYLLSASLGISFFANIMLRFVMSMWVLGVTGSAAAFTFVFTASILPAIFGL